MAVLEWDKTGERFYETGIEKVVLFVQNDGVYGDGVAWSGVSAINENPSGGEKTDVYADNMKYLTLLSTETFGATIEAYQYPDEWGVCDGSAELTEGISIGQQQRSVFGLAYITKVGNDTKADEAGYKVHLIYGAQASPSDRSWSTMNDSPEADAMSWEISTTPIPVEGYKPTSTLIIDSRKVDKDKLTSFLSIIHGSSSGAAKLPLPSEVLAHFSTQIGG